MSFTGSLTRLEPAGYAALRIAAGFMFAWHGAGKMFGILGHKRQILALDDLWSQGTQIWLGGVIELVGGVLIMVGLFTRVAAFIASGTMAVAYFQFHWKLDFSGYRFLPLVNRGEASALYSLVFLFIAARGPGIASLDRNRGD